MGTAALIATAVLDLFQLGQQAVDAFGAWVRTTPNATAEDVVAKIAEYKQEAILREAEVAESNRLMGGTV